MKSNGYITKTDVEKVGNLLINHIGKNSAIKARDICTEVGFETKATNIHCRMVIAEVEEYYELPIISCHKGYFIAETDDEIKEYIKTLETNIRGMEKRRNMLLELIK